MTADTKAAPAPEGGAVELHLKLLDTLKPFAEVAEKLKHCHVVEICEPTPDNPSRNIIPMPREWFERAADDLEAIAIQLHGAEALSEGQASKLTGLDRVEVRKLADALAAREEASAEAGEVYDNDVRDMAFVELILRDTLRIGTGTFDGVRGSFIANIEEAAKHIANKAERLVSALRAQPQAREDATVSPLGGASVGPDEAEEASSVDATPQVAQQSDLGTQDLIKRLEGECCNCGYAGLMAEAAEALKAREDAQPFGWIWRLKGRVHWNFTTDGADARWADYNDWEHHALYTHPAPDALRRAVEALIEAREDLFVKADKDEIPEQWASVQKIDQALAALQAEQKGGA